MFFSFFIFLFISIAQCEYSLNDIESSFCPLEEVPNDIYLVEASISISQLSTATIEASVLNLFHHGSRQIEKGDTLFLNNRNDSSSSSQNLKSGTFYLFLKSESK